MGTRAHCVISFLFLSCLAVAYYYFEKDNSVLLVSQNGILRGLKMVDRNGGSFYAFQSVPYAEPPIGHLRFKGDLVGFPQTLIGVDVIPPPQNMIQDQCYNSLAKPVKKWKGILDATKDIPACKQNENGTVYGVEDCLYLNVYTPQLPNDKPHNLKSVMVYIHGGAFREGSATINNLGPHFLITEDVVIVVINCRLGVLGFLNLQDLSDDIVPNLGLKDQITSLRWIQENIADFGGDPKCVTIFGESSGGISVHYHMFSKESRGLFHRVIAQSSSVLFSSTFGIKNNAIILAKHLGIQTDNLKSMVEELQKLPLEQLFQAQENLEWRVKIYEDWIGAPIIEGNVPGAFLQEEPYTSMITGNYNAVPLLIGWTNREGIIQEVFQGWSGKPHRFNITIEIPNGLASDAGRDIQQFYFGNKTDLDEITERHIDLWTDNWYRYFIIKTAREHAKYGTVYLYEFSADTEMNFFKKHYWRSAQRLGACHVDDLGYLFKSTFTPGSIKPDSIEDKMIRVMVRMWANFGKYGKPIVKHDPVLNNKNWLPIINSTMHFMNISNNMREGVLTYDERIKFWDELYEKYEIRKYNST